MDSQDESALGRRYRSALLVVLAGFLGLVIGCQSFTFFKDPPSVQNAKGDLLPIFPDAPSRYSFRIAPYVFLSDFPISQDLPLFKELAGLRDQVYKELQLPPSDAVVQVYLFENRERYEEYIHVHYKLPTRRAFFIQSQRRLGGEELLVYTFWGDRLQQDLRHELTHALLHSVLKDVPLWLDEGLAEYFELAPAKRGVNRDHIDELRSRSTRFDMARLETLHEVQQMTAADYRESWAWVHFLLKGKPEAKAALLSYLALLRHEANPGPLAPSLVKAIGNLDDVLEKHLEELEPRRASASRR